MLSMAEIMKALSCSRYMVMKYHSECVLPLVKKNNKYSLNDINRIVLQKVAKAHFAIGCESNIIICDKLDAFHIGMLIQFFEVAAATGAYLLNVNPFDQPGVNVYKKLVYDEIDYN